MCILFYKCVCVFCVLCVCLCVEFNSHYLLISLEKSKCIKRTILKRKFLNSFNGTLIHFKTYISLSILSFSF